MVSSAVLVAGPALPAAADPPTLSQAGVGIGHLLIDPTASNAETDIRISPNGLALGDFVLGKPDATPEHERGLDLEIANVRISD